MRRISLVNLVLTVLALTPLAVPALAQGGGDGSPGEEEVVAGPKLSFEEMAVKVTGATPAGDVVIFGVSRDVQGFRHWTARLEAMLTADEAGETELALARPFAQWSVIAAVDVASGALTLTGPDQDLLREIDFPARGLGAALRFMEDERQHLELLLVRPGVGPGDRPNELAEVGAWSVTVGDGGESDRDGETNGAVRLSPLDLRPVGDSPPAPEALAPGDVIVGVDGENLRYYHLRLAAPAGAGGGNGDGTGEGE